MNKIERKRANALMFACEYHKVLLENLRKGSTVSRFVLEPANDHEGGPVIEFELVVTRLNQTKLPRSTKGFK